MNFPLLSSGAKTKRKLAPKNMNESKCICRDELGTENVYVHLAWCPQSYFYKDAVKEYIVAPFWKKWFMRDPRKYHNFLWTPPY